MDDNSYGGLGGLGGTMNNIASNPLFLAGLQMLGNTTPKIGAIPNPMEGVPTVLMSAQDRQRKAQDEAGKTNALASALQAYGMSPAEANTYAKNPAAASLMLDQLQQKKIDAEGDKFFGAQKQPIVPATPPADAPQLAPSPAPQLPQAPSQSAPNQPARPYRQTDAAPAPQQPAAAPPDEAAQQALAGASQKFDDFGRSNVNKTVAEVAAGSGDQTTAAKFLYAARQQGLGPQAKLTGQILSDPATAMPLAQALGIGADLSPEQWQQAHTDAFQASLARRAAAQAPAAEQAPAVQVGTPQVSVTNPVQVGPAQGQMQPVQQGGQQQPNLFGFLGKPNAAQAAPQQQPAAPAQQPDSQQPAAPQTVTEKAMAIREQSRVADLEAKIAYNERFLGSKNPAVKAAAAERIKSAQAELAKTPEFTTIGKDFYGREIKGFVDKTTGRVTPYNPPSATNQENPTGMLPGDTVEERLQQVPEAVRPTIKKMIEGRQAPPSSFAMKTEYWQNMMNMANRVDPNFDDANWHGRVAETKAMSSGGKTGQALTSTNTLINHLGHLDRAVDKLGNTSYQWLNKPLQALKAGSGDKEFQVARGEFETYRKGVSDELVKLLRGGVGASSDVADWNEKINMAKSPAELHQVIDSMTNLMLGRVAPLVDTHNKAFGTDKPVEDYLSPDAKKTLQEIQDRRTAQPEAAPAAQPRRTGRYPGNSALPPGVKSIQVVE